MEEIVLLVSASVAMDGSDINRIQSEIDALSKKIKPLKLDVEIADSIGASLSKSMNEVQRELDKINDVVKLDSSLGSHDLEREADKIVSVIDTISGATEKMNVHTRKNNKEVIDSYRMVGEELSLVSRKVTEDIEKINSKNKELKILDIPKAESSLGQLVSQYGDYINTSEIKDAKQQLEEISKMSYQDAILQLKVFNNNLRDMRRSAVEAKREFSQGMKLELVDVPKAEANIQRLKDSFGDVIDKEQIAELENMLKGVANLSYDESRLQLQQINSTVTELRRNARDLKKEMQDAIKLETIDLPKIDTAFQGLMSDFGEHLQVSQLAEVYELLDGIKNIPYDDARIRIQQVNTAIQELREEGSRLAKEADVFKQLEEIDKPKMIAHVDELIEKFGELGKVEPLHKLKEEISSLSSADKDLAHQKDILNVKIREAEQNYTELADAVGLNVDKAGIFKSTITEMASALGLFSLARKGVQSFARSIKDGARYTREMDSTLTEIAMVTGKTRDEVSGLTGEFNGLARELGATASDISQGAVEFFRQGLSTDEVMERLRYTTMFAKQANLDFGESAELITAIVNGMSVETERATDVMVSLGNATATSAEEIGRGVARVSGTAGAMGVEFEKVSSWVAAISAKTRENAESIGSSINMILSRMNQITTKGFFEDDGTSINDVEKALATANVQLRETRDGILEFRNSGDVLDDLAANWDNLDEKTQRYVGTTLAGARQLSRFYNLMEGYGESLELYNVAMESEGTTIERYDLYMQSAEAATGRFRQAVEELYQTLWSSESLTQLIDLATRFVELLDVLVDKIGIIGTGGLFVGITAGVKALTGLGKTAVKMAMFESAASGAITSMEGLAVASKGLEGVGAAASVAGGGLSGLAGTIVAGATKVIPYILAVVAAIALAKNVYDHFNPTIDFDVTMGSIDELHNTNMLVAEYQELSRAAELTSEQKERLAEVNQMIMETSPELIAGFDEEGNVILENNNELERLIELKGIMAETDLLQLESQLASEMSASTEELKEQQAEMERLTEQIRHLQDVKQEILSQDEITIADRRVLAEVENSLKSAETQLERVSKKIVETGGEIQRIEGQQVKTASALAKVENEKMLNIARTAAAQADSASSAAELNHIQEQLIDAGFGYITSAMAMRGEIAELSVAMDILTDAQNINTDSLYELTDAELAHKLGLTQHGAKATRAAIEMAHQRIRAIQAEMEALLGFANARSAYDKAMAETMRRDFNIVTGNQSVVEKPATIKDKYDAGMRLTKSGQSWKIPKYQELVDNQKSYEKATIALKRGLSGIDAALSKVPSGDYNPPDFGTPRPSRGGGGGRPSGKSGGSSGKSGGSSGARESKAEADRYEALNALIDKNSALLQHNENIQKGIRHNNKKKLKMMEQEMVFLKNGQVLQNALNNERRKEREELRKALSKEGFMFSGVGDDAMITNLEHIHGKSKDVESAMKRFIEIQTKEIPDASNEWFRLKEQIDELKVETLTVKFEDALKVIEDFDEAIDSLGRKMELLGEEDYEKRAATINSQYRIAKEAIKEVSFELDNLINHGFKKGTVEFDAHEDMISELIEKYEEFELTLKNTREEFEKMRDAHRRDFIEKQNKLYDEQQDRLSALNSLQSKLVSIIKERQKVESDAMKKRHKEEMDRLKERHDRIIGDMKDELDEFNKLIDEKIARLREQHAEEDYEEAIAKERAELAKIEAEVNRLSLDDSLEGRSKYHDALKKLEEQQTKIEKMERDKARKDEIKYLEDKKKDRSKDHKDFTDKEKDKYDTEKERLQKIQEEELEALKERYNNYNVYSEARQAIIDGEIEYIDGRVLDLQTAIDLFERNFGEKMGIMGDSIEQDFINQWEKATEALRKYEYRFENFLKKYDLDDKSVDDGWTLEFNEAGGERRPREFRTWDDDDYNEYLENKRMWAQATTQSERDLYERKNRILRERYGMDEDKWTYGELAGMQSGRPREFLEWSEQDYKEYMDNKKRWDSATTQAERNMYAQRNQLLRSKYGMKADKWSYDDLSSMTDRRNQRPREFLGWTDEDYRRYVDNKRSYERTSNESRRKRLSAENEELRRRYWNHNKDVYDWRELMAGYDTGGFIPRDGVIMAHEKEMVVPFEYQEKLWSAIQMLGVKGLDAVDTSQQINKGDTIFYDVDVKVDGRGVASTELDARIRRQIEMKERDRNISLMKRGVRA